jgi:hypothetical protein
MAKKAKRSTVSHSPKTGSKDLTKIDLSVNTLGKIAGNVNAEEINAFLDENVPDKKFSENEGLEPK